MDNNEKNKTLIIVILAIVAICGCLMVSCCAAAFYTFSKVDRNTISELLHSGAIQISTNASENVSSPVDIDVQLTEAIPTDGLSTEEWKIIQETEKIRGITAQTKLAPIYETEDELREYMMKQLEDITDEEFADELGLYTMLGFTPEDFDLRQFYVDLYTEQTAGFYDPAENAMYLIEDDSPYQNAVTLSHEYTHYLQYNNDIFSNVLKYEEDFCKENAETCIIIDALVEGDASLTENLIDAKSILGEHQEPNSESSADYSVFGEAPKFFQDSLLFSYLYGFDFVAYHYMRGGFDAVNDLYTKLPQSVEQIMHPEKYLVDEPIEVSMEPFRSMIADEYTIINDDVMNEDDILMILSSGYDESWQLTERQAVTGSAGWGGGSYIYAKDDEESLFFSKVVWDSEKEAIEAETAFELYCGRRFGTQIGDQIWEGNDDAVVHLIRQDDVLYWMILPEDFDTENFIGLIKNGSAL